MTVLHPTASVPCVYLFQQLLAIERIPEQEIPLMIVNEHSDDITYTLEMDQAMTGYIFYISIV